jgi:uncharacterized coiled-coil protein SlyX
MPGKNTRQNSVSKTPEQSQSDDFTANFRAFLLDSDNQRLFRESVCGPILEEIRELKDKLAEKDALIETLSNEVGELRTECEELRSKYTDLESKSDDLEQYSRRNSLRICGVPETKDENCLQIVLDLANKNLQLSPPLTPQDIDRTHRTGKHRAGKIRNILVKFVSYSTRHRMMEQRLDLMTNTPPVYINEDLTQSRSKLLAEARQARRDKLISKCWSSDGRIFIRDNASVKHLIKTKHDLEEHFTQPQLPLDPLQHLTTVTSESS